MAQRMNLFVSASNLARKLGEISYHLEKSIGSSLVGLIHHRASQMNSCAFCVDMDVEKAKIRGENDLKIFHINVGGNPNYS